MRNESLRDMLETLKGAPWGNTGNGEICNRSGTIWIFCLEAPSQRGFMLLHDLENCFLRKTTFRYRAQKKGFEGKPVVPPEKK